MVEKVQAEITFAEKEALKSIKKLTDSIEKNSEKITSSLGKADASFERMAKQFSNKKAPRAIKSLGDKVKKSSREMEGSFEKAENALSDLAQEFAIGTIAANAILSTFTSIKSAAADVVRSFIDIEQAQIGVAKTTDLTTDELILLRNEIAKLSREIPASQVALLGFAEVAGTLGVQGVEDILRFTRTIANLELASDVAGEAGGRAILTLLSLTGEGVGVVDRFSSSLVALGNDARATESQILNVATEVAAATTEFGLSSTFVLGLSTTLKEAGREADASGSIIGKTFRQIGKVIRKEGEEFKFLQKVTALTGEQLKKTFKTDAGAVFISFIEGLKRLRDQGITTDASLEKFGLTGDRVNKVLPPLVQLIDRLAINLERSKTEFDKNTAASNEAEKAADTLGSQIGILGDKILDLALKKFGPLGFFIKATIEDLNELAEQAGKTNVERAAEAGVLSFGELSRAIQQARLDFEIAKKSEGAFFSLFIPGVDEAQRKLQILQTELKRVTELAGGPLVPMLGPVETRIDPNTGQEAVDELQAAIDAAIGKTPITIPLRLPAAEEAVEAAPLPDTTVITDRERQLQSDLLAIREEADLLDAERVLLLTEARGEATAFEKEQLTIAEEEKIIIRRDAELRTAELIKNAGEKRRAIQKIDAKAEVDIAKLTTRNVIKAERERTALTRKETQARADVAFAAANLGAALAKDGSKLQFIIQKGAAIAQSIVAGRVATALALATPPGPPTTAPLAASVQLASNLNTAAIIATSIKGFQGGGILPGTPNPLGRDTAVFAGSPGEVILNAAQQGVVAGQLPSSELLGQMVGLLSQLVQKDTTIQIGGRDIARVVQDETEAGFDISA